MKSQRPRMINKAVVPLRLREPQSEVGKYSSARFSRARRPLSPLRRNTQRLPQAEGPNKLRGPGVVSER